MRSRAHRRSRVLSTAVVTTVLLAANGGPSSIAVAQSGILPLTPLHGFIDHVSAAINSAPPTGSVLSSPHALSGDGRFVVMESSAPDLIASDGNAVSDVFLRDRQAGVTTRVSETYDGSVADGPSQSAAISTNGRYVVFASGASNLVPGDSNGVSDVFVRDLQQARTMRISISTAGAQTNADSYWPAISADGRYVAFTSDASTLVDGAVPYQPTQAYLHDRDADGNGVFDEPGGTTTSLVSAGLDGGFADGNVDAARVSADGRYVLFGSQATTLTAAGNPDQRAHLYRRDRLTGQTTLIDRAVTGGPSAWGVSWRSWDMSDDGRYVTYASISSDIVPYALNFTAQVYRYDAAADPASSTVMVSALPDGSIGAGSAFATSVTADGRLVAFTTTASNLVSPAPSSSNGAIAVRDMLDGTFTRVDVLDTGAAFDHTFGYSPSLSGDGTAIAFQSNAPNALDGMFTWNADHVFVATAFSVNTTSVTAARAGAAGAIDVNATLVSGWNAVSLDPWITLTDGAGFGAGPRTVHYLVDANTAGIVRDGRIRLGSTTIAVHQDGDADPTPPTITPLVTGALTASGWYVGPVTVQFSVADPESPIVSQSDGCRGVTVTGDTIYAPVTCEATSGGGVNSRTVVITIDNTAPAITIGAPTASVYAPNTPVAPSFSCTEDSNYSGVATCTITEGSSPIDTTPGRHTFTVTATDRAGNSSSKTVEYLVGSGVCVPPIDSLKAWWRFEGTTLDQLMNVYGDPVPSGPVYFAPGVAGQSWEAQSATYLVTHDGGRLLATDALTIAAWMKPAGHAGESGTIVSKPSQYRVARYGDGTLRWAFNQSGTFEWINTGVMIPSSVWTHVAVVYDHGVVNTYVNGRLAHTYELTGTLVAGADPIAPLTIGGRADASASYFGWLDELQMYGGALSGSDVERIALAGGGSTCLPQPTEMTLAAPSTVPFGSSFQAAATLRDAQGRPIAGKSITFTSYVSAGGNYSGSSTGVTDNAGQVQVQLPIAPDAPAGRYTWGVTAQYAGDLHYAAASGTASIALVKGTPSIVWPSPSAIVYGTALGGPQLNATAETAGTFTYSPARGTVLEAGTHVLGVTFTPSDGERWNIATAATTIVVDKAVPTVSITAGTFTYDMQPHAAEARAIGVLGEALSPVPVFYNGTSQMPPVDAGVIVVSAHYEGSANYASATATDVLVIEKVTPLLSLSDTTLTYDGQSHGVSVSVPGVAGDSLTPVVVTYGGSPSAPSGVGVYTIEARYDGSTNYNAISKRATLTILKAAPSLTWRVPASIVYGTPLDTAQLNAAADVPGTFTYTPAAAEVLGAGTHTLTVSFAAADAANYESASATVTLAVSKANASLHWERPADIVYGTPVGAAQLNASANVAGTFSYTPSAGTVLSAGEHVLSATFTPEDAANYTGSSASTSLSVARAPLTIAANASTKVFGAPLPSFRASAEGFVNGDTAASLSGVLTFATTATAASATGEYPVFPQGLSSANYALTFVAGTLTVLPASTATAIAPSANPIGSNQPVTFTATVSVVAPGSGAPTGVVQFFDGGTLLGSAPLVAGTAALTTNGLIAGSHAISATYCGDGSFTTSTDAVALTVRSAASSTSTTVSSSDGAAVAGQSITFTASISSALDVSGSVAFYDGAVLLGTARVYDKVARFTTATLAPGGHAILAVYLGSASAPPSTSPVIAQFVQLSGVKTRAANLTLSVSPSTTTLGSTATMTSTVTVPFKEIITGQVVLLVDGVVVETTALTATGSGVARSTFSTSALPRGTHRVEAVYLGDDNYRADAASTTVVVN